MVVPSLSHPSLIPLPSACVSSPASNLKLNLPPSLCFSISLCTLLFTQPSRVFPSLSLHSHLSITFIHFRSIVLPSFSSVIHLPLHEPPTPTVSQKRHRKDPVFLHYLHSEWLVVTPAPRQNTEQLSGREEDPWWQSWWGCSTSSLAGRSKVGGSLGDPRASAKFPHSFSLQINASRQKKVRSLHAFHRTLLPPTPFFCLPYFFHLFSEAAAATLQTTNNFPFSCTWLFQILVRLYTLTLPMPSTRPPFHTERPAYANAHLLRLISNVSTEWPPFQI